MATDADGNITSQQWFDPFGAQRPGPNATSSNWDYATANSGFTGHQHDVDLASSTCAGGHLTRGSGGLLRRIRS